MYLIEKHIINVILNSKYSGCCQKILEKLKDTKYPTILTGSTLLSILHRWDDDLIEEIDDIDFYVQIDDSIIFHKFNRTNQHKDNGLSSIFCSPVVKTISRYYNANGKRDLYDHSLQDFMTNVAGLDSVDKMFNYDKYLKRSGYTDVFLNDDQNYSGNIFRQQQYYHAECSRFISSIRDFNIEGGKLQFIETKVHPWMCVDLFDFDFCKVYYDIGLGKLFYLDKNGVENKTHSGPIEENKTNPGRKEKYLKRGYHFNDI